VFAFLALLLFGMTVLGLARLSALAADERFGLTVSTDRPVSRPSDAFPLGGLPPLSRSPLPWAKGWAGDRRGSARVVGPRGRTRCVRHTAITNDLSLRSTSTPARSAGRVEHLVERCGRLPLAIAILADRPNLRTISGYAPTGSSGPGCVAMSKASWHWWSTMPMSCLPDFWRTLLTDLDRRPIHPG
jgi:hypothetical protein